MNNFKNILFVRDSRHAFGHRFQNIQSEYIIPWYISVIAAVAIFIFFVR